MDRPDFAACNFCGGTCPSSPTAPLDACGLHGCNYASSRETTETSDEARTTARSDGGEEMNGDSSLGPQGGVVRTGGCRCEKLRQLCCGSYARYLQRMVRFENWHCTIPGSQSPDSGASASTRQCSKPSDADTLAEMSSKAAEENQQCHLQRRLTPATPAPDSCGNGCSEAAVVGDKNDFWVFGYGSLVWKNDGLPAKECVAGFIKGFKRVFFQPPVDPQCRVVIALSLSCCSVCVQLSDDHRGTRSSPGLVANILPLEVYRDFVAETAVVAQAATQQVTGQARGCCAQPETESSTRDDMLIHDDNDGVVHGVALRFDAADLETVISKLDYREKGGYSRILVEFFPLEEESRSERNQKIHAFVYVGLPCNRNFYCFPDFPISPGARINTSESPTEKWVQEAEDESPERSARYDSGSEDSVYQADREDAIQTQESRALLCRCCPDDLAHAAGMILRGEGFSGPNTEYLFKLADFLRKIRQVDEHVFSLEARVKQMMKQQGSTQGRQAHCVSS